MRLDGMLGLMLVLSLSATSLACGEADEDEEATCGTQSEPIQLTLTGLEPAIGASVTNDAILHAFTVVGVRALFQPALRFPVAHTAGMPDPPEANISFDTSSPDVRYEFTPMRWENAPANVVVEVHSIHRTSDDCFYEFPRPLFSCSVSP